MLGISRSRVAQLAVAGRLPFSLVGGRPWFRADHIDLVKHARAARDQREIPLV